MATIHGKNSYFSVGGSSLTSYLTDISMDRPVDMAESTVMGLSSKTYVSGMKDATLSISGRYDSTAASGPDAILNGIVGGATASAFEYGPEGNGTAKVKYSGSAFLTSYNVSSPVGDVVAFSAEFQCTGDVTKGTF